MMTAGVPRASASVAALVMLAGLALIYWSLTGLGVLVVQDAAPDAPGVVTPPFLGGGFSGGSSGGGGGEAGGGW